MNEYLFRHKNNVKTFSIVYKKYIKITTKYICLNKLSINQ